MATGVTLPIRSRAAWGKRWSRSRWLVVRAAARRSANAASSRRPARAGGRGRRAAGGGRAARPTPATSASPASGPSTMAAAIARLRVTTGLPVIRSEQSVEGEDLGPLGLLRRRGRSCTAAMAAWSWYSPTAPGERGVEHAVPSAIAARSQRPRSCSASGDRPPARRPARPPGLDQQHQGQQPGGLGVGGQQPVHQPGQPDRLAGQIVALRSSRAGPAYPSLNIR